MCGVIVVLVGEAYNNLVQDRERPISTRTGNLLSLLLARPKPYTVGGTIQNISGSRHILARSGVAALVLAAAEIVQVHVVLSALFDRRFGVVAEATADGVGDDPKPLSELVDEAEGTSPMSYLERVCRGLGGAFHASCCNRRCARVEMGVRARG